MVDAPRSRVLHDGLVFWVNDRRVRQFHAVWHVFVIAGSACHFVAILLFVVLAR